VLNVAHRAVQQIIENLPAYMMVGIIAVVALSQVSRFWGSLLGVAFWLAVAYVGHVGYSTGHELGIATVRFSRQVFYGLCGMFVLLNLVLAWSALQNLKRKRPLTSSDPADREDDAS
jgi:hypothetical protein